MKLNLLRLHSTVLLGITLLLGSAALAEKPLALKPLALVYKGLGSCSLDQGDAGSTGYGCSEAAADVVKKAGLDYRFVGPSDLPEGATPDQVKALFSGAAVWVQPGGVSAKAARAMSSVLKSSIVDFVREGGGYVGFCAGAFLATAKIGTTQHDGLGIFPGTTEPARYKKQFPGLGYSFLHFDWQGKKRRIYFEGGPILSNLGTDAEVVAKFSTGHAAAARSFYGKGRVFVSAPHPEAPAIWSGEDGHTDPDGSDYDLGAQMILWSAGLSDQ